MKSKTSFFNGPIFRSMLTRFWPLWAAYLVLLAGILLPGFSIKTPDYNRILANGDLLIGRWELLVLFTGGMAVVTAMCVFGHLYYQRQTALIASLPVRRESVYLSCFTAGLASMAICDVIIVLLCAIVEARHGVLTWSPLLVLLASLILLNLAFYGFAAFCAMLTGSVIVLPLVFLVLEVVAYVVSQLVQYLLSALLYGYIHRGSSVILSPLLALSAFCPLHWISGHSSLTVVDGKNLAFVGAYCAAGIVFALLGLWLYRRRAMETTGEIVAVKFLRPVFRWCMALGCGLVFACVYCALGNSYRFYNDFIGGTSAVPAVLAAAVLGCAVGWFGSEMLMQKTFRVFGKKWPGFCLAAVILVCGLLCANWDITGYEPRVPAAEDVAKVTVTPGGGNSLSTDDPEAIRLSMELHQAMIDGKSVHQDASRSEQVSYTNTIYFFYELKSGGIMERSYTIYDPEFFPAAESEVAAYQALMQSDAAYKSRSLSYPITDHTLLNAEVYYTTEDETFRNQILSPSQAAGLYEAIEEDLEQHRIGQYNHLWDDPALETDMYVNFVLCEDISQLDEEGASAMNCEYRSYDVLTTSESTLAWLRENLGIR